MHISDDAISMVSVELPRPGLDLPFPLPEELPRPPAPTIDEPPLARRPPKIDPTVPVDPTMEPPDDEPPHVEPVPDDN